MPKVSTSKPAKPVSDDFPLWLHPSGRWCKKIRQRVHYFGKDRDAALEEWLRVRDYLLAGHEAPSKTAEGLNVRDLVNEYLTAKQRQLDAGELKHHTFKSYYGICDQIITAFGKRRRVSDLTPDDFGRLRAKLAKVRGPITLGREVQCVRSVFKYAFDAGLIDRPVRFGPEFKKPSARAIREARHARPIRMFTPDEINTLMAGANVHLRCMVLLAVNCGLGNQDVAELPQDAVDLNTGILNFPRPKTMIARRATLWPETVAALRESLAKRRSPKDPANANLWFLTKYGYPWVRENANNVRIDSVGLEFGKLLRRVKLKRPGVNFYALRHVFESIAGDTGDQPAVDRIMGHADASMAALYREWRGDQRENDRLRRVTDHVHQWLFAG